MKKIKIMVFGTFDGLHKGHVSFFKQARALAPNSFLIVSVARDINVQRIKGHKPFFGEKGRLAMIKEHKFGDKVVLGGTKNYLPHVLKESPDIIALGYDQRSYVKNLKKDLKNKGILVSIVRLKSYRANVYKNHLLKNKKVIK